MALLSQGTRLFVDDVEIVGVTSTPDISQAHSQVEVTHLNSSRQQFINGIIQSDELEFELLYTAATFAQLNALPSTSNSIFSVRYPDGFEVTIIGQPSITLSGASVDEALSMTLTISVFDMDIVQ